jgi:energy-coupling factor transport system ATP-binding protein
MSEPVLELEHVSYSYPGVRAPALSDVTLAVGEGELVVLAGRSGSGKSTLLRVASGLVPHFHGGAFTGRALVAGMDIRNHGPADLAFAVGTLLQDPETQVVMGTVRAELALPLENRGEPAGAIARAVEEAALALGIEPLLDRSTSELSGGELQRVALAAAIAGRPSLIVLDEPTSQLDPVAGDELITLLRRLNDDLGAAIVVAEHRLERCLGLADRVIALDGGQVICDAPPERFASWAVQAAPDLATPGARLLAGVGLPVRVGVKAARAILRERAIGPGAARATKPRDRARGRTTAGVLRFDGVWYELREGPAILRDVSLSLSREDRVALMGANGAGKSTLLRHGAGLLRPTRGRITADGRVALLLQNPTDYLVHETVSREAGVSALRTVGLDDERLRERHPRDLSGGEKQRLALAVVLGEPDLQAPGVLCLDEPTRGMDRARKGELAAFLRDAPSAVIVATHDPEFAAAFATRVVLLGSGTVIADAPAPEILAGGTYFATETARILGGAGGALTPAEGVALLLDTTTAEALV